MIKARMFWIFEEVDMKYEYLERLFDVHSMYSRPFEDLLNLIIQPLIVLIFYFLMHGADGCTVGDSPS